MSCTQYLLKDGLDSQTTILAHTPPPPPSPSSEVMYCKPPESLYVKGMEQLELKFRVESKPVVGLILLLMLNTMLYVILLPFIVSACMCAHVSALRAPCGLS